MNRPSTVARSPRALPQALILALLVGGTGAFVAEQPRHAGDADRLSEAADTTPDAVADAAPAERPGAPIAPAATPLLRELLAPHKPAPPAAAAPSAHRARHARPHRRSMDPLGTEFASDAASTWGDDFTPRGRHRGRSEEDVPFAGGGIDWFALARCESGGNAHITDPSGRYGGLYQFDAHTWHSLGGHGLPQDASPSEQTSRARALYRERGLTPWPSCGRRAER